MWVPQVSDVWRQTEGFPFWGWYREDGRGEAPDGREAPFQEKPRIQTASGGDGAERGSGHSLLYLPSPPTW